MKSAIWSRRGFILSLLAVFAVLCTYFQPVQMIEYFGYDMASVFIRHNTNNSPVTIIALDAKAEKRYGQWPWSHNLIAKAVRQINSYQPKAMGVLLPLFHQQTPEELASLKYNSKNKNQRKLKRELAKWRKRLDADKTLAQALTKSRAVIAADYQTANISFQSLDNISAIKINSADKKLIPFISSLSAWFLLPERQQSHIRMPISKFVSAASGVGISDFLSTDKNVRGMRLAYKVADEFFQSFVIRLVARAKGYAKSAISLSNGPIVRIGSNSYQTDVRQQFYPKVWVNDQGKSAIPVISLADILRKKVDRSKIKNKTILLGLDASSTNAMLKGPGGLRFSPLEWNAHAVASLLGNTIVNVPNWFYGGQRWLIVVLALTLFYIPFRLHGNVGILVQGFVAVILLNVGLVVLIIYNTWLPVTLPAIFLILSQIILAGHHNVNKSIYSALNDAIDARCALAANYKTQGQLDRALEEYMKCPLVKRLMDPLYYLALDLERRRQFTSANSVYSTLANMDGKYKDVNSRIQRLNAVPQAVSAAHTNTQATMMSTMVVNNRAEEKPVLGRYELDSELGKGAMGVVYLGIDPKIGRKVAIKTLSLSDEFDSNALEDARKRFFREAKAAGRLDHPNIITIYDAGEEHGLAYIAMDYAPGESLDHCIDPKDLLKVKKVLNICAQVAEALDYAHGRDIVHRDIKPGNIIYDADTGSVKVTDFGIACMTNDSKTRSGTILGSPSYMSPEQVQGKKVSGASDLYSLGVTLFQLLTGRLPFVGDSLANLMYKITSEKPLSATKLRPKLPSCAGRIITKALQKDPDKRYSSGEMMADALRQCTGK